MSWRRGRKPQRDASCWREPSRPTHHRAGPQGTHRGRDVGRAVEHGDQPDGPAADRGRADRAGRGDSHGARPAHGRLACATPARRQRSGRRQSPQQHLACARPGRHIPTDRSGRPAADTGREQLRGHPGRRRRRDPGRLRRCAAQHRQRRLPDLERPVADDLPARAECGPGRVRAGPAGAAAEPGPDPAHRAADRQRGCDLCADDGRILAAADAAQRRAVGLCRDEAQVERVRAEVARQHAGSSSPT